MIKVNLKYANGATYETETATVADLLGVLQGVTHDMPIFLLDNAKLGKIPLRVIGVTHDADVSSGTIFLIESVVLLD